ncbi:MAG: LytR family transcriptional regulator [Lachnospiraceae bacterium]|nr:LytR family transcriptional regulator [Lachnospiraceae bacterium]
MKREPKHPNRFINMSEKERRPERLVEAAPRQRETAKPAEAVPRRREAERTVSRAKTPPTKKSRKFLIPVVIGLIVLAIAVFAVIFLNKRNYPVNTMAYGISEEARLEAASNSSVLNVVFLGVDHQEDRSDVMMVISVDQRAKSVDVISLLRDTRVEIEGHAPTKLGYAYKWGGTDLALNTINTNFNTAFDRYICMTFEDLVDIVDAIGGVDIELTATEADHVNDLAQEAGYMGWSAVPGWNTLNGAQALGYARIRKIDSEYARAGRQQVVIQAIIKKVKSMPFFKYPVVAAKLLGNLKTNLSYGELLNIALIGMKSGMVQHTIPDGNYEAGLFGGWVLNPDGGPEEDPVQWLWIYDLEAASYRLKRIMYDPDYWEDPNLPAAAWEWNELEDVIGGMDINISDIDIEDEEIYVEPETAPQGDPEPPETEPPQTDPPQTEPPQTDPEPESSTEEDTTSEETSPEEPSTEEESSSDEETSEPIEE